MRPTARRMRLALRRLHIRRWLPDLGDLAILAGVLIIGHVFYQLAPIIGEAYAGLIFCLVGMLRMFGVGRSR